MEVKILDKQIAHNVRSFRAIAFDLEAVLTTQYVGDAQIYYKKTFYHL